MPTIHMERRVFSRSEHVALRLALAHTSGEWSEASRAEGACVIWDVWLNDAEAGEHTAPRPGQLHNRFPGMADCCRKALFASLHHRLCRLLPLESSWRDGRYIPPQWALPSQLVELRRDAAALSAARRKPPVFIVKPDAGSMGDGIALTTEPWKPVGIAPATRECVAQLYIGSPMLLGGLKFDLRLYVLLTAVDPLVGYIYREGLARFAVHAYSAPSHDNLRDVHMHLTNYSLNKRDASYVHSDEPDGADGSKRTASAVLAELAAAGRIQSVEHVWERIGELAARALAVVQPCLAAAAARGGEAGRGAERVRRFQIVGIDVLLDSRGEPHLIEMNDHPSLRVDWAFDEPGVYSMNGTKSVPSAVDEAVKVPMIADALRLVARDHRLPATRRRRVKRRGARGADGAGDGARAAAAAEGEEAVEAVEAAEAAETVAADEPAGVVSEAGVPLVCATRFVELPVEDDDAHRAGVLRRLRMLFVAHSPAWALREDGAATDHASEASALRGPRWRAQHWVRFLRAGDLIGGASGAGPRARADGRRLGVADADLIYLKTCGRGGCMGLVDFFEACAGVALRVVGDGGGSAQPPAAMLEALLERCGEAWGEGNLS